MKKLYMFLFASVLVLSVSAQLNEFGIGYQLSLPQLKMKDGWSSGHGIQLSYFRHFKEADWLSVGTNIGIGSYAMKNQPQQYRFSDGTITNTTATLSSSLGSAALAVRLSPLAGKKAMPFIEIQGGNFWMHSTLFIADPTDPLGCRALENKTLVKSGTMFASAGAGLQLLLGKGKKNDLHFLEISARSLFGNNLEYANMNRLYHDHTSVTNPTPEAPNEKPLVVRFINVTTNVQHEHTVAELYNHPLRVLQFNVQYAYRFSKIF
jgi:hypothetical protein